MLTHIGIDQHGKTYHLFSGFPRKELCEEHFPHMRVEKLYVDKINGTTRHIGYVFGGGGGIWVRLWNVGLWERRT